MLHTIVICRRLAGQFQVRSEIGSHQIFLDILCEILSYNHFEKKGVSLKTTVKLLKTATEPCLISSKSKNLLDLGSFPRLFHVEFEFVKNVFF